MAEPLTQPMAFFIDRMETPVGELLIVADADGKLRGIDWTDHEKRLRQLLDRYYRRTGYGFTPKRDPSGLTAALRRYFKGEIDVLKGLPVATNGTSFQTDIWKALRDIGDGTTITYAELARRVGKPKAIRAAGLANGQNPISIVVPCHRVIGSDGSLTGYGGGLPRKKWLLKHEGFGQ